MVAFDSTGDSSLLRDARVVDDPGCHRCVSLERDQGEADGGVEDDLVIPRRVRDEMVERLMARSHMPRVDPRCHRLDALAIAREHQPRQVRAQRLASICMPAAGREPYHEVVEPLSFGRSNASHGPAFCRIERAQSRL